MDYPHPVPDLQEFYETQFYLAIENGNATVANEMLRLKRWNSQKLEENYYE